MKDVLKEKISPCVLHLQMWFFRLPKGRSKDDFSTGSTNPETVMAVLNQENMANIKKQTHI